jgi:hypothetical protein
MEFCMTRRFLTAFTVLTATSFAVARIVHTQTLKIEKVDIKGVGSTDYIAVESLEVVKAADRLHRDAALLIVGRPPDRPPRLVVTG